ncbi:FMRFamide-activated amiloride-sensitive sodium channel-like [Parasteatoda tepidariorum]|uniref:FMRFamide-activated amiloride-sensitive sodium channel-like n=1 Tax=Parasteatoda tepidariorum TaxID=114398 RepID=UPI0039BC2448
MVWGTIGYTPRSPLVRTAYTSNSSRYISDVLGPVALPNLRGFRLFNKEKNMYYFLNSCSDVFYEVSRDVSEIRESIEHFGNIGGYVGMWLGISLVAVFDFLSTAFALLKFPFQNFTIKKTRVLSISHQARNKNVENRENKSWSDYLTNAFRDSMLSGVPQILMAESKTKKYALLLAFLSCLAGYTYQSSEFLKLFWKYETVVDIQITNSKETELPSITICNFDGSNVSKICEEIKPDWCKPLRDEYRNPAECNCLDRICENGTLIDKMVLPPSGYNDIATFPPNERLEYIQDLNDVIRGCSFVVHGKHPEDCDLSYFKKSSVSTPTESGFLSGCWTLNTVFGRPNAKPSVVTSSGTIVLNISIDEREYIYLYHPPEGLISIHNPYRIVNPHIEGFTLSLKTQRHTFHLKKVVKKLLPYPYDTNCIDYMSRWKERGGRGPMNDVVGIQEKNLDVDEEYDEFYSPPEETKENEKKRDQAFYSTKFNKKIEECAKKNCGPACYEESYLVIKDVDDVQNEGQCNKHSKDNKQKNNKSNLIHNITVIINLNDMPTTTYSYRPKFESVELWSNIGGYIGIWLGISLIALCDFFDTVIGILLHLCQKLHVRAKTFLLRIFKR